MFAVAPATTNSAHELPAFRTAPNVLLHSEGRGNLKIMIEPYEWLYHYTANLLIF